MTFSSSVRGIFGAQGKGANKAPEWVTAQGALSSGQTGSAYSVQLSATDETTIACTYTVVSGSLPNGVTLSSSGLLSGTPTVASTFSFTVRATDVGGGFAERAFSIAVAAPIDVTFNYTGGQQSQAISTTGTYTLEVWGAQGGGGSGGSGGYAKGYITLNAGTTIYCYVGGQGSVTTSGGAGFNGGGAVSFGDSAAGGGGGMTDFRYGGNSVGNQVIVGGGGGGQGPSSAGSPSGGAGGGTNGSNGQTYNTGQGGTGGTQSSGGSLNGSRGQGGATGGQSNAWSSGAGGGGYYGGGGGNATQPHGSGYAGSGGGGSGYIGGVSSGTMSTGVRNGNGTARIRQGAF